VREREREGEREEARVVPRDERRSLRSLLCGR
jgi:hypothetical protein